MTFRQGEKKCTGSCAKKDSKDHDRDCTAKKLRRKKIGQFARFYAGAVQLANLGALTRIILSGVLLSKF